MCELRILTVIVVVVVAVAAVDGDDDAEGNVVNFCVGSGGICCSSIFYLSDSKSVTRTCDLTAVNINNGCREEDGFGAKFSECYCSTELCNRGTSTDQKHFGLLLFSIVIMAYT